MTDRSEGSLAALEGSYLTPSFEHALVSDAMRTGVISCPPDTSMEAVARIMATNHVHAVVITGLAGGGPWGVVTDADLLSVAREAPERLAGSCATHDPVMVKPEPTARRGRRVDARGTGSLTSWSATPMRVALIGVLSSLDVAGIVAWGRG